jgi:hypothetical protein
MDSKLINIALGVVIGLPLGVNLMPKIAKFAAEKGFVIPEILWKQEAAGVANVS